MRVNALFLLTCFAAFIATPHLYASSTVRVGKSRLVLGESTELMLKLEGPLRDTIQLPEVDGLQWHVTHRDVSIGISQGRKAMGETTLVISMTPTKAGVIEVPALSFNVGDQTIRTQDFTLQVSHPRPLSDEEIAEKKPDFFIRREFESLVVYLTQPFLETVRLYLKRPWQGLKRLAKDHPFVKDFEVDKPRSSKEIVGGTPYTVVTLKRILVPLKSMELELESIGIEVSYADPDASSNSFLGRWFQNTLNSQVLRTPPALIGVNALPQGAPDSFEGFVGEMELFAQLSEQSVHVGQPTMVTLTFQGSGWMESLEASKPSFPSSFKVYPERPQTQQSAEDRGLVGSKTMSYVVIAQREGNYDLGTYSWSYFDSTAEVYRSLSVDLGSLEVLPAAADTSFAPPPVSGGDAASSAGGLQALGEDIKDLQRFSTPHQKQQRWLSSPLLPLSALMLMWFMVGLISLQRACVFWRAKRQVGRENVGSQRYIDELQRRLRLAIAARDPRALQSVFSEHAQRVAGLSVGAVTVFDLKGSLATLSLSKEHSKLLADVFSALESPRYAGHKSAAPDIPDERWQSLQDITLRQRGAREGSASDLGSTTK